MAKPPPKSEDFRAALRAGAPRPVYLFYGEDERSLDRAVKEVEQAVLEEGLSEFNSDYFFGKETDPSVVVASARTMPMMAQRRLVVVKRAEEIKAAGREALLQYLASPNPTTVLVLAAPGLAVKGPGSKAEDRNLVKAAQKAGAAVHFPRPTAQRLPGLIQELAREQGKRIDPPAIRALIDLAGDDPLGLEQQLMKIALFVEGRESITEEDVVEAVADIKESNIFEFTDAIAERDAAGALKVYRRLRADNQEPLMILGMMARHFRTFWKIKHHLAEDEPPLSIAKRLGLNEFVFKKAYLPRVKKFSLGDAGRITRALADLDIKLKSTSTDKEVLFERTLIGLCSGRLL